MRHGRDLIEQTVRACTALGQRLLILSKDADQVPRSLPNTAFHSRWAPMDTTLPRCAALIHHGGVGTMARAFQAGSPQVVIPFCHDQPDNSDRVSRLGAGAWVSPNSVLRGGLKKVLKKVLNHPDMRDRCHALAAEISHKMAIDKACSVVAETKAT
jgi:UDP:flavonoid glycosyltransferase YjiC (YdhE family)